MDSTNNHQIFLSEFKDLRNELSAVKKRIVQLEESHEKQQERLDFLERENHALKTQLNNLNGIKAGESALKRKRTDQEQDNEEENESKTTSVSASVSADKKKAKITNNNEVIPRRDNGDSFDSLSDDLLHKIVEFDGNCYSKFGSINKRCKNIYDMEEYKLKKQTCLYGYGTLDMMLEHYLRQRREGTLDYHRRCYIAKVVIWYNRLDVIDWIIQLGDIELVKLLCEYAARYGRIDILSNVFLKCNLTILDELLLENTLLCFEAAMGGKLENLEWLRKYGAEWDADTFIVARDNGDDEMVQYLRAEGCPEEDEYEDVDGEPF